MNASAEMKNLHKFLNELYCPICCKDIFTEIVITFDAYTQRNAVPFKMNINYVRHASLHSTSAFKYVKYRDDDDRKYDPGFDRAANNVSIARDGSFIFDSNVFSPDSYAVYGSCNQDHFTLETGEVYLNSLVEKNKHIKIGREEFQVKNYTIINDYHAGKTKVYIDNDLPPRLVVKLSPSYILKNKKLSEIVSKIESLLVLS